MQEAIEAQREAADTKKCWQVALNLAASYSRKNIGLMAQAEVEEKALTVTTRELGELRTTVDEVGGALGVPPR